MQNYGFASRPKIQCPAGTQQFFILHFKFFTSLSPAQSCKSLRLLWPTPFFPGQPSRDKQDHSLTNLFHAPIVHSSFLGSGSAPNNLCSSPSDPASSCTTAENTR